MNAPLIHECPDGSRFSVSLIQVIRDDPYFRGSTYTFHVDPAGPESVEAAGQDASAGEPGQEVPVEEPAAEGFRVSVHLAPIFLQIATPQQRLHMKELTRKLVTDLLDRGHRGDAELRVSSDGAVRHEDRVVDRLFPLGRTA